ncbi:MAG: carbon-nitrogen hydrolase family protein [Planctomycetota bacterium]
MKTAIAQISPVFLDRIKTTSKVIDTINEAANAGCKLVAFGEAFLPGYPVWLACTDGARFDDSAQKAMHALYMQQAVSIEEGHLKDVVEASTKGDIMVVLGIVERPADRGGHSLYCSCVIIDPALGIVSVHRKLMPTYEERLSWGIGDGHGLKTHRIGEFTLGALNCWENWMPLARAALYAQGENLHIAIWPGCERNTRDITRFIAQESRSFVMSASAVLTERDIECGLPSDLLLGFPHRGLIVAAAAEAGSYNGGSCIAGPDGQFVVAPVLDTEGIIVTELDFARVSEERQNFDPSGHYSRPDVLSLSVSKARQSAMRFVEPRQ